jgi:MFS superfamily sulfate permease-like transporter
MGSADGNWQNVQWLTYLSSASLMPRRPPPTKAHRYSMNLREQPCRFELYRGSYRLRAGCRDVRGKQLAEILSRGSRVAGLLIPEGMAYAGIAGAPGRTFAAKHGCEIAPNQELFAMGIANLTSGLLGGMIVGGGMSGTAANDSAGAHTQLSTITASLSVGITSHFCSRYFATCGSRLGAIIVYTVAHLADVGTLKYYAKLRTGSIWVALVALFGVLQMGILKGLIVRLD